MAKRYVQPEDVISPQRYWRLFKVLYDAGEDAYSVAIGRWEGEAALVMRWNGNEDNRIGNPQSRGLPTWFVVPPPFQSAILRELDEKAPLSPGSKAIIQELFPELQI